MPDFAAADRLVAALPGLRLESLPHHRATALLFTTDFREFSQRTALCTAISATFLLASSEGVVRTNGVSPALAMESDPVTTPVQGDAAGQFGFFQALVTHLLTDRGFVMTL